MPCLFYLLLICLHALKKANLGLAQEVEQDDHSEGWWFSPQLLLSVVKLVGVSLGMKLNPKLPLMQPSESICVKLKALRHIKKVHVSMCM